MKVHHIGYLVKHIDEAVEEFCKLGWQPSSEMIRDEFRQVTIIFLQSDGNGFAKKV